VNKKDKVFFTLKELVKMDFKRLL